MFKKNDLVICRHEERTEANRDFEIYARVVEVGETTVSLDRYQKNGALHINRNKEYVTLSIADAEEYYKPMAEDEKKLFADTLSGCKRSGDKIHLGGDRAYDGWEKITPTIADTMKVLEPYMEKEYDLEEMER